jgi:hypothetical protein
VDGLTVVLLTKIISENHADLLAIAPKMSYCQGQEDKNKRERKMSNFTFSISQSQQEADRLQIVFDDMAFGAIAMLNVNRVGSRRDANNQPTHWVFPHEVESNVRNVITSKIEQISAQEAAAQERAVANALAAEKAKVSAAKASENAEKKAREIEAFLAANPVEFTFGWLNSYEQSVQFPYADGAASKMKSAGAVWNADSKKWVFRSTARNAIDAILSDVRRLVAAQQIKEAKKSGTPKKRTTKRNESLLEMDDEQLEMMSDDGNTSRLSMSADEVRAELGGYKIGRRW